MHAPSLVLLFANRLQAADIDYMVTGSVASTLYGEPRMTNDVDLIIHVRAATDFDRFEELFPLADFYVPPPEVMKAEHARRQRGHFNIIHHDTGFKADVFLVGRDPLHAWAFQRRRKMMLDNDELFVAPPEYVIVRKLEFHREGGSEKHLNDIAGMLRVSDDIDLAIVEKLAAERGLSAGWSAARALR